MIYQAGDQIMAASYTVKGDTLRAVSRVDRQTRGNVPDPDGKRLAVLGPAESPAESAATPKQ